MNKIYEDIEKEMEKLFGGNTQLRDDGGHYKKSSNSYDYEVNIKHGKVMDVCAGCGGELDIEGNYCSWCLFDGAS